MEPPIDHPNRITRCAPLSRAKANGRVHVVQFCRPERGPWVDKRVPRQQAVRSADRRNLDHLSPGIRMLESMFDETTNVALGYSVDNQRGELQTLRLRRRYWSHEPLLALRHNRGLDFDG